MLRAKMKLDKWLEGFKFKLTKLEVAHLAQDRRRRLKQLLCPDCANVFGTSEEEACPQCGCKECYEDKTA
jgi:hypothetical protein